MSELNHPLVGVLFLKDLYHADLSTDEEGLVWSKSQNLTGELLPPTVKPPPGLVLVVNDEDLYSSFDFFNNFFKRSKTWLSQSKTISIVINYNAIKYYDSGWSEDELSELIEIIKPYFNIDDPDSDLISLEFISGDINEHIKSSIKNVRRTLENHIDKGRWEVWSHCQILASVLPQKWVLWKGAIVPDGEYGFNGWNDGALIKNKMDAYYLHLSSQFYWSDDSPNLLDSINLKRTNLSNGKQTQIDRESEGSFREPTVVMPDGESWISASDFEKKDDAICIDPSGEIACAGWRGHFSWYDIIDNKPVYWTTSNYSWPDGNAGKISYFHTNKPRWVHLSPDASAYLAVFGHDALISSGFSLRWRDVGGFALAERARHGQRALFFDFRESGALAPGELSSPEDPQNPESHNSRAAPPTISLGPSEALRYVVGLEGDIWRILQGTQRAEFIGGEASRWAVYNAQHEQVREGSGRLLAGWDRWIVVLEDGQLRREDLIEETRVSLGPAERHVHGALALPASPNVLLISIEGDEVWLRVV